MWRQGVAATCGELRRLAARADTLQSSLTGDGNGVDENNERDQRQQEQQVARAAMCDPGEIH
ncbi:MAG: hypothetical protein OD811_04115 [Alphaproteobacteria bacterium]